MKGSWGYNNLNSFLEDIEDDTYEGSLDIYNEASKQGFARYAAKFEPHTTETDFMVNTKKKHGENRTAPVYDEDDNVVFELDPETVVTYIPSELVKNKVKVKVNNKEYYMNVNHLTEVSDKKVEIPGLKAKDLMEGLNGVEIFDYEWSDMKFEALYFSKNNVTKVINGIIDVSLKENPEVRSMLKKNFSSLDSLKEYLHNPIKNTIDWSKGDKYLIDNIGKYFGEIIYGLFILKGLYNRGELFSDTNFINGSPVGIVFPTESNFAVLDSMIEMEDGSLLGISSKAGRGASASIFTGIIQRIIDNEIEIPDDCFVFQSLVNFLKDKPRGYTSQSVYYTVMKDLFGMEEDALRFFDEIYNSQSEAEVLSNKTYKKVLANAKEYLEKSLDTRLEKKLPYSLTSILTRCLEQFLNNNQEHKDFALNILGAKEFYQLRLDMNKFKKGEIYFNVTYSGDADIVFDGRKGTPGSTAKGLKLSDIINYVLK